MNAVDRDHFLHPMPRPADLPDSPVAVYVGTLHEDRLDVPLVAELARAAPDLRLAFVGPDRPAQVAGLKIGAATLIQVAFGAPLQNGHCPVSR